MELPNSKFEHVYAVVRFDFPVDVTHPENSIAIVKVLSSRVGADEEASRLTVSNGDKGCRYKVLIARYAP